MQLTNQKKETKMPSISVDLKLECRDCGAELSWKYDNDGYILVTPCDKCITDACEEAEQMVRDEFQQEEKGDQDA